MKELVAHASNLLLVPKLDAAPQVKAQIELILICSEPTYSYDLDGLARGRSVSDMRVLCGHRALREMAKKLIDLADEAESLEDSMNAATAAADGAA